MSETLGVWVPDSSNVAAGVDARTLKAAYIVEAAWGQGSTGLFRFGISHLGSTIDVLAASEWSASFNGPYDQMSAITRTIQIDRGRDNDLTEFKAGQVTASLRDAAGIYNPYNTSSPLVSTGFLDTDKPLRVSAVLSGVTYPLIYAFISDIEGDPSGRGTVQIAAADFLDRLERTNPILTTGAAGGSLTQPAVILPGGGTNLTTGQILGYILDWYQWQDPSLRLLGTGDTVALAYTVADGTRSGLTLVSDLMTSERGITFVAAGGAVTYINRQARYMATSLGSIDRTIKAFPVGRANANVVNNWTVQRTDMAGNNIGVAQTAWDETSIHEHGTVSQSISTPFLNNDNQALGLAQYLLNRTKNGIQLAYEVPLSLVDQATMIQALSRDIGDRVTLSLAPRNMPAISGDFYIESISHQIQCAGSPRHQTTWRVSQVPSANAFRFGISTFGGPDVLTY